MKDFFNLQYYHWKRNNWLVDPRTWLSHFKKPEINKPIFFVGNQGDGITFISRIIRRHNQIVNITGNNNYWTGADEMQGVMALRLPRTLVKSGKWVHKDPPHPKFFTPRVYSYASDDLVDKYRYTEKDYTPEASKKLKTIIGEALYRFGRNKKNARFVDKSQSYGLKMKYVEALLAPSEPYFVLISREPIAAIYRQASTLGGGDMRRYKDIMDFDERLEVCIQHWCNKMSTALKDGKELKHFTKFKFEDFLVDTEKYAKQLCEFLELDYNPELIPQPHHKIPFGTRFTKRWYPVRLNVNDKYYKEIPVEVRDKIYDRCAAIALELGYEYKDKMPVSISK